MSGHCPTPASLARPSALDTPVDEARLLAALLADDAGAWRTFHDRYAALMMRAIARVKSRFPNLIGTDDVAEIFSDLCVQLLSNDKRRLRHFDPTRGTCLGAWLSVLARHA